MSFINAGIIMVFIGLNMSLIMYYSLRTIYFMCYYNFLLCRRKLNQICSKVKAFLIPIYDNIFIENEVAPIPIFLTEKPKSL